MDRGKILTVIFGFAALLLPVAPAGAEVIGFVDNPEGNSADWRAKIAQLGETVVVEVNFDTHPVGPIIPNHYADRGIIISGTGKISRVVSGPGPGQGNTGAKPKSEGEGLHAASNHVFSGGTPGTFTLTFDQPVTGAGVFLVDLFNPRGQHPVKLEAFTGPFGTGDFLGSFNAAGFNFQKNFSYFMGVVSTETNIGSIRIDVTNGVSASDWLGLEDVLFAGGGRCTYTINKSKAKGGCETCPKVGTEFKSQQRCKAQKECRKKFRTRITCPQGEGKCKLKGRKRRC